MSMTPAEAAKALDEVNRASERIATMKGYNHGARYFIVWGLVWLVANTITQFWPQQAGLAWSVTLGVGVFSSIALGILHSRKSARGAPSAMDAKTGQRIGITTGVAGVFLACLIFISRPDSFRETNAVISIFFPFVYMGVGVWTGWRLFAIGAVTAAAIMAGYVWIEDDYFLWMGLVGGGSLIAGGLWLRSA